MDIEEKLQHFMDVSMLTAEEKNSKIVDAYKAKLDRTFEDHKKEALRKAQLQERVAADSLSRATRKDLSHEQITIKRELSLKLDALKDKVFDEVLELLAQYRTTPEYYDLLLTQIKNALKVARDEQITIYIDPEDSKYVDKLSADSNFQVSVSDYSFMGGTRAVISSKNILIDNSFASKFEEAKAHFVIEH